MSMESPNHLHDALEARGLSDREAARVLGLYPMHLIPILRGERTITEKTASKIIQRLIDYDDATPDEQKRMRRGY